jgi:hypothetical protein
MKKIVRVYLGSMKDGGKPPSYRVRVKYAKKEVRINGTLEHAIKGRPGVTIGCHLSYCAGDKMNAKAFPHPVIFLPAFTRSRCVVITKWLKNDPGADALGVIYQHDYSDLVELNDKDFKKIYVKDHPEWVEREFVLRPLPEGSHKRKDGKRSVPHGIDDGSKRAIVPRGALARARDAGLLNQAVVELMK